MQPGYVNGPTERLRRRPCKNVSASMANHARDYVTGVGTRHGCWNTARV